MKRKYLIFENDIICLDFVHSIDRMQNWIRFYSDDDHGHVVCFESERESIEHFEKLKQYLNSFAEETEELL